MVSRSTEADEIDAQLWAAPSGEPPAPPVATRAQVLPIGELPWPDAEKLFLRLLNGVRPVQYAKLFGVPGQKQAGIDAYARLPLDLTNSRPGGRHYITLQSRRVDKLTAGDIKTAVDDLLKGEWAAKTAAFYFATSFDLQATKLDAAIRQQTDRLAKLGIEFVPWGIQEVSQLLKDEPRIVDDFFDRPWVERVCGREASQALGKNLTVGDVRDLRAGLRDLYRAVFYAQGGVKSAEEGGLGYDFVILDVEAKNPQSHLLEAEQLGGSEVDQDQHFAVARDGPDVYVTSRRGARRRSFRSARRLLSNRKGSEPATTSGVAGDQWLAEGKCRLLVGRPGAGKSSLLRFAATDLLSSQPQSAPLQREHASNLPIWLPFGFLCRHLAASTENSVVSATEAWLKSQSAVHLWPLVERALQDDRLLMFIDGIDEWSSVGAAERALGMLEAFLGHTRASAVLSTRPYAIDRLNWRLAWSKAEIKPLSDDQRRAIAAGVLLPTTTGSEAAPTARPAWSSGVDSFLDQLVTTSELAELSRSPLFLTLLAATWHGEPLPLQRFKIYDRLVDLLIEKHPQMRQRSSYAQGGPLTALEMTTLFAAVAYKLRAIDSVGAVSKPEMLRLVVESMTDDEVLGYEPFAARRIADAVLNVAEDEFGLLVSHGAGSVGFLHRVVLDHLAGQYLATLSADEQASAVSRLVRDPGWRDVLLALLTTQVSPHAAESLLAAAIRVSDRSWADVDGWELLAEALTAGVKLTPKSQTAYLNQLMERIETHPSVNHRANLVTALVGALANKAARNELLPVMKRWLTAIRPDPSPAMWALRDLDIADDVATKCLLWGMRHPEDDVKVNAAAAIAYRFGGQPDMLDRLVDLTEDGPSSATQAAALFAIGEGWREASVTARLIDWARRQPSTPLRLIALDFLHSQTADGNAASFLAEEREWLLSLLWSEYRASGPWPTTRLVNAAAAGNAGARDFALNTLTTNGQTGGDRTLAWFLACNTFSDDDRFRAWVATQLAKPEDHRLILYNIGLIPEKWRDEPTFAEALRTYVEVSLTEPFAFRGAELAPTMAPTEARAMLLRALDNRRPYAAARELVEQYGTDDDVRAAIIDRLRGDYPTAAAMAGVAVKILGPTDGFALLVSLLRRPSDGEHKEEQVVLADAVADAWTQFKDSASDPGAEGEAAREILANYDPAELAALCTGVDPHHLMWHVPAVIAAWPDQRVVQEFADNLIHDPVPIMSGIPDTIPVAILRAYGGRTDQTSRRILDKTLNLLSHLEPELREVLAFELARSSLSTGDLRELMADWGSEPDSEVRRNAFIGLARSIMRQQRAHANIRGASDLIADMECLRTEIRRDLCAYGPELEERRQLAWIGMLMLGDLTLSDNLLETLGYAGQVPGVQLTGPYDGSVDEVLVELIAENWPQLRQHFGDGIFERLNGTSGRKNRTKEDQRRYVLAALATVASRHPAVAEMLRYEADTDAALRRDTRFVLWAKVENGGDEESLRALVGNVRGPEYPRPDFDSLDSLLDRDSWNVSDDCFKSILRQDDEESGAPAPFRENLALFVQLFPKDDLSAAALRNLETWCSTGNSSGDQRRWVDDTALTVAFAVGRAEDLPAVAARVHERIRMVGPHNLYLPMFVRPLMRRLRRDPEAVEALRTAVREPAKIREESALFASTGDAIMDANPDLQPLQRTYLFAVVLRQAGALPIEEAVEIADALSTTSPDTVVHNPFTNHEGPLRLAALDLTGQ
jgi:hypothetical protein